MLSLDERTEIIKQIHNLCNFHDSHGETLEWLRFHLFDAPFLEGEDYTDEWYIEFDMVLRGLVKYLEGNICQMYAILEQLKESRGA